MVDVTSKDPQGEDVTDSDDEDVLLPQHPVIGIAKVLSQGPVNNFNGTYSIQFTLLIENMGNVTLSNIQVDDDLHSVFFDAASFTIDNVSYSTNLTPNPVYDGSTDTNLLSGTDQLDVNESGSIVIDMTITPGVNLGPYFNTAVASGESPLNEPVADTSQDGTETDPDMDGNPNNNSDPTPVVFFEVRGIGIAKTVSAGPVNNNDGTYTLEYTLFVQNNGLVPLSNIQVMEDLSSTFNGAIISGVSATSLDFNINPMYDGLMDVNVLDGTDILAVGGTGTIVIGLTVAPGANLGPYDNTAIVSGISPSSAMVMDESDSGTNPSNDPLTGGDNPGEPGDSGGVNDPTPVIFTENPVIGIAKRIIGTPYNNNDGSYTLNYTLIVENLGDVPLVNIQVTDDLSQTFNGALSFLVNSVNSTYFTINPMYNGSGDINLLSGTDMLPFNGSETIDITVTVVPGTNLGPYENTAIASGESIAGTYITDDSQDGAEVDPDNDGDPGNNDEPTVVTFEEAPGIGVAKAITSGPVNNHDGTYTLTYTIFVENTGDVPLSGVQVVEDLNATFAGAVSYSVVSVTSGDFSVNGGFNGDTDKNLLAGSDNLAYQQSGTIVLTVTIRPGTYLGPYENTSVGSGTSPGGTTVTDDSQDGAEVDPDNDGDPGNNDEPTVVTFEEAPGIGVAKAITSGPVNNHDGTYTLTYTILVENTGDVPLSGVQVVEDLNATFAGAVSYSVVSVTSGDFSVNGGFNGDTDKNLLAGTDNLAYQQSGTIVLAVTVRPGTYLGPYENTAVGSGTSPGGTTVTDDSQDGAEVDPDNDGDPGNNDEPTVVTFEEAPGIGVAKAITSGPVNNHDGTYTLTYTILVENTGDVPLSGVQVVEDLNATFGGAVSYSVVSVTSGDFSVNGGFNGDTDTNLLAGTDNLAYQQSGTIVLTVTVRPGTYLGPYENTAVGSGTSPGGTTVTDDSQDGAEVDPDNDGDPGNNDEPTVVTFEEAPGIGVAKAITSGPVNNHDGTYTLTYTILVENTGDVPLSGVQVVEDLNATFAGAVNYSVVSVTSGDFSVNGGFNGDTDKNLLAGSDNLAYQQSGTIALTVTVRPGTYLGPYENTAVGSGTSPGGTTVTDDSQDGAEVDPDNDGDPGNNDEPTVVTFEEAPGIGVAKAITSGPVNNHDGTYTLTYTILVENTGDVPLSGVQVVEDLNVTFGGAVSYSVVSVTSGDFSVNGGFNGDTDKNLLAGTDNLAYQQSGTIVLTVTVRPGTYLGPYENTAVGSGTSPGGTTVTDDSQDGAEVDPDNDGDPGNNDEPTVVTFEEAPGIGVAKAITSGPVNNHDGTYTLTYTILVENTGDVPLSGVQVVEDLNATFAGAVSYSVVSVTSGDFSANGGFNGDTDKNLLAGSDNLAYQQSGTIVLTVTVRPGTYLGPYENTAVGSGTSPGGTTVTDDSQDGVEVDPDNDGDPGNNDEPTVVTFEEAPGIGVAKAITSGPVNNHDGTYTLTYTILVENTGDVPLSGVQVVEDLNATFAGAVNYSVVSVTSGDFSVNGGFNGDTDKNLLAGSDNLAYQQSGTIVLTVTVRPGTYLGPYENTAVGSGTSPGGTKVTDDSQDGAEVDPDNDGDPGNNDEPTVVTFEEAPGIGVAKAITSGPVNNHDGTYTLTYTILVENTGDVPLSGVQVVEDLNVTFGGAVSYSVVSVTSGDFSVNGGFNGDTDKNLLAGSDNLAYQQSGTIVLTVTVRPGTYLGPYENTAVGSGTSPGGTKVTDDSQDGAEVDPDNDGDPGNNDEPTVVTFEEAPGIGVAKAITSGPVNNHDGTYTLTYTILVENTGDVPLSGVQVVEDLNVTFGGAVSYSVVSVTSGDFSVNGGFNGDTDKNLLAGSDNLAYQQSGTIVLTVTVRPGTYLGPYENTAVGSGTSPGGTKVTDDSQDGAEVDPDNDGDPGNNDEPTVVTFEEAPGIGVAKAITSGPVNNHDGTYTLTYTILVENTGDVPLSGVQVVEDLNVTFGGAVSYSVVSVTSGDFSVNGGFNGDTDKNLLAGSDNLAYQQSGTIVLTVTVRPGTYLGPYENTAAGSGTSPGGTTVTDDSQDGAEVDPDNDGDPGNNDEPTVVRFEENPVIGISKAFTYGPVNNGDQSYTLEFTLHVENRGDVPLSSVQVTDDLNATFAGAESFSVLSVSTSSNLTANPSYNGDTDINLLSGTDILPYQASGTITIRVLLRPGPDPAYYENIAFASGDSPGGTRVTDSSQDGDDVDPDGNDDPTDNNDPTPVPIPAVAILKNLTSSTLLADGDVRLTFDMRVKNIGNVRLSNFIVEDPLPFASALAATPDFSVSVVNVSANTAPMANSMYNGTSVINLNTGSSLLLPGQEYRIILSVDVNPVTFAQLSDAQKVNQATVYATPVDQSGNPLVNPVTGKPYTDREVFDASDDTSGLPSGNPNGTNDGAEGDGLGSNPYDDPTPIRMPSSITLLKAISSDQPPVKLDNANFVVTYEFVIYNNGGQVLNSINLEDDLQTQYGCAFVGNATDPVVVLENNSGLSVVPTSNTAFTGSGVNTNMLNGDGTLWPGDRIRVTVSLEVNPSCVNPAEPLWNQATVTSLNEEDEFVSDLSDDNTDMDMNGSPDYPGEGNDDPTPLQLPAINIAKSVVSVQSPLSGIVGNRDVRYRFVIQNTGNVDLSGIDLIDPIRNQLLPVWVGITQMPQITFSNATVTPLLNPLFDGNAQSNMFNGTSGLMRPGQIVEVELVIEVNPNADLSYPALTNQATTQGDATLLNGNTVTVTDVSDDGINPEGTNPEYTGDTGGSDDPTPLIVPVISAVKYVVDYLNPLSGISGHYDVLMNIGIKNIGNVHLANLNLRDTIELAQYVGPFFVGLAPGTVPVIISSNASINPVINTAYNGRVSNPNMFNGTSGLLAPGQEIVVQIRIEIDANNPLIPDSLWNRATALGSASRSNGSIYLNPFGQPILTSDDSDAGTLHESTNPQQPEDRGTDRDRTLIEVLSDVGDFVWMDNNNNGIQDAGEPGIPGITVQLYDCNNNLIRTTTTNSMGLYLFDKLVRGNYRIRFIISSLGSGFTFTNQFQGGNQALDSNADAMGWTPCFAVNPGQRDLSIDAGVQRPVEIGDFVWHDLNGDGLQTAGEPGIPGVQVNLYRSNGAYVATRYTDANGLYLFTGIPRGSYYLEFIKPADFTVTFPNSPGPAINSDVTGANGPNTTATFTLVGGQSDRTWDAGYYKCVPIGEYVWYDINKNDIRDINENGINGLMVQLWRNQNGIWVQHAMTTTGHKPGTPSDDGWWQFCAPPGQYYVKIIMPPLGLVQALPFRGGNPLRDSDLTNAFGPGTTNSFSVVSGTSKLDIGGGYYPMAVAGNLVWRDDNLNGLQDPGEPKMTGVLVEAFDANTHQKLAESVTDNQGVYELDYLEKRDIYVKFHVPNGFTPTVPRAGTDDIDSDVDHTYGLNTTRKFSMWPGVTNENIDLGVAFGALPVNWLDISARRTDGVHHVQWTTSAEINVSHYVVERRMQDTDDFVQISEAIPANRNLQDINRYLWIDRDVEKSGTYVYRVKQLDYDGKYSYSRQVSLRHAGDQVIDVYPNPARFETNVEIGLPDDAMVEIDLLDAASKLIRKVRSSSMQLQGTEVYKVDLNNIPPGIYNVVITIDGVSVQKKLIRIE
jgi:hypothetical protein